MDLLQEHILPTLHNAQKFIPPSIAAQALSYYTAFSMHFTSLRTSFFDPYILSPLTTLLNSPPDISSILLLLAILFLSLKVVDYARRLIAFWVRLVFRLVFWGFVVSGAWYVYSVGWGRASREAGWLFGLVEGFVDEFMAGKESARNGAGAAGASPPLYGGMRQRQEQMRWQRS
ncbi:hypothetical protein AJ80_07207 [Polytolypa hystricis UAMH7299]|uniref:Nuclear pore assembly and biogenesis-domain-containing protein n=1 Tax=Polytolypa hystricis (strain UAMH7299) TaxID=1447883 RepID=A0A2B7XS49_POLH7|nr:hypothetical protein AJ80_07207 [Polytolypa hystricis UAMH7299]